ncbi:beta-phosphoglucomutase family hydrolase [Novispirillum sp. DQ9]|uniref:beta-phosphoglucomutase family hydrolase n=1 Tax=Novispirillum sp. DQ9 TaxID=3398612 RepID=UPI003C7B49C7
MRTDGPTQTTAAPHAPLLDLPARAITAVVLDLDGVVTRTARVHARAWKHLFDAVLRAESERSGAPFVPFDIATDYPAHVDGLPRLEGVRRFLAARGLSLPEGTPDDPPGAPTLHGLGNRKNAEFTRVLAEDGVEVFSGALRFIRYWRGRGLRMALNSSSKNARLVLDTAGLTDLFDAIVDGTAATAANLPGKPAPDTFVHAAALVGARPEQACVVEDALAGVQSGKAGGFALVIGIDRGAGRDALLAAGADVVVNDLGDFALD